jgi:hypothetical protein
MLKEALGILYGVRTLTKENWLLFHGRRFVDLTLKEV